MNALLVIIVTYNALKWIDKCVNSVCQSSVGADLFIVDNGSKDGTAEYIKQSYPFVTLIERKENLGFGKANNIGIEYALKNKYDYVYLLNQDAWVLPDTFRVMIDAHIKQPEYGILSPVQLTASMDRFDKNFDRICKMEKRQCSILEDLYFGKDGISSITCVMAAHWLISRQCLLKVGGFSPAFPHYDEDDNYAERALYKGFKIGIVSKAKAVHDREYRVYNKDFLMYKSYVDSIRLLSSINETPSRPWYVCFRLTLWCSIKYKSLKPLTNFIKLLKQRGTIKRFKLESYKDTAFLTI